MAPNPSAKAAKKKKETQVARMATQVNRENTLTKMGNGVPSLQRPSGGGGGFRGSDTGWCMQRKDEPRLDEEGEGAPRKRRRWGRRGDLAVCPDPVTSTVTSSRQCRGRRRLWFDALTPVDGTQRRSSLNIAYAIHTHASPPPSPAFPAITATTR
jgi:hypothetical protein